MRRRLGVPDDAAVIGLVARFRPSKDHATLLRAFARLAPDYPRLHLALVGDGPLEPTLRRLAAELGVADRVVFAGPVPGALRPQIAFDVAVLSSTAEGFPNVVVEALAAGVPVVATDVGGVRDSVEDGRTGLLVPPRDPEALAQAVARLLADPAQASCYAEAGRDRVWQDFRQDAVVERLIDLYSTLVRRSERRRPGRSR